MTLMVVDEIKKKTRKVRAKDLQENILRIRNTMEWVESEINETVGLMKKQNKSTEEGIEKYKALKITLRDLNEIYSTLQDQEEKQYEILKKYKNSKFYIAPKDLLVITGVAGLSLFMIALDRENPKALKLASFVLRLFPINI